jgi:threonine synthase
VSAARFELRCLRCEASATGFATRCPRCGGAFEPRFRRTPRIRDAEASPLRRYFEFLPLEDLDAAVWTGAPEPTPCRRARALEAAMGHAPILLKDETVHPTRTTKDRMASVVLSSFRELGVRAFASSSTGNSSTSLAIGLARVPELTAHLFCGEAFLGAMSWPDLPNVRLYVLEGASFVDAFEAARAARVGGSVSEGGFFNPARRAGLKLAFLEAVEQAPGPIDWYFQAVSSGMGVLGTWRGALELEEAGVLRRRPRVCCVQQASCSPMVAAWRDGAEAIAPRHVVARPSGPARAILRGDPTATYPYLREIVATSGGAFEAVDAAEIAAAQALLHATEGVTACAASACTVAALGKLVRAGVVEPGETVLLNVTGRDREPVPPPPHLRLVRADGGWVTVDGAGARSVSA